VSALEAAIDKYVVDHARKSTYSHMSLDPKVETYLGEIRARLGGANASEEEEVVHLIAARIQALTGSPGTNFESAIELLGPPAKVAQCYRDANLISRAAESYSPLLLLRASLRNGFGGVLAFLVALAGYWIGECIAVFGTLAFVWSAFHHTPNGKAAIGSSMIEDAAMVLVGIALIVFATLLLRILLRASNRARLN